MWSFILFLPFCQILSLSTCGSSYHFKLELQVLNATDKASMRIYFGCFKMSSLKKKY